MTGTFIDWVFIAKRFGPAHFTAGRRESRNTKIWAPRGKGGVVVGPLRCGRCLDVGLGLHLLGCERRMCVYVRENRGKPEYSR